MIQRHRALVTRASLGFALIVLVAAPAARGAETLFRAELGLHDAAGKRVGAVQSPVPDQDGLAYVTFTTGSRRTLMVGVRPDRLVSLTVPYFTSSDCTGPPLAGFSALVSFSTALPSQFTMLLGPRHSVRAETGPRPRTRVRSRIDRAGACESIDVTLRVAPTEPVGIDLADYFTPPFSVRATPTTLVPLGAERTRLGTTELAVYDSTGKQLGRGWEAWPATSISVPFVTGSGVPVIVTVSGSGFSRQQLFFEAGDCTGPPFVNVGSAATFMRPIGVVAPGIARARVWRETGERRHATMGSGGSPGSSSCRPLPTTGWFAPAERLDLDLLEYFTPPFSVRGGTPLPRE